MSCDSALLLLFINSEGVFQDYGFENSSYPCDQFRPADQQDDMSSQSQVSERTETPLADPLAGMVFVPDGEFRMGSDSHYPEEAPTHRVSVGAFWVDSAPGTNGHSRRFSKAQKNVTFADIPQRRGV